MAATEESCGISGRAVDEATGDARRDAAAARCPYGSDGDDNADNDDDEVTVPVTGEVMVAADAVVGRSGDTTLVPLTVNVRAGDAVGAVAAV